MSYCGRIFVLRTGNEKYNIIEEAAIGVCGESEEGEGREVKKELSDTRVRLFRTIVSCILDHLCTSPIQ